MTVGCRPLYIESQSAMNIRNCTMGERNKGLHASDKENVRGT